jgi:hypothetical protein
MLERFNAQHSLESPTQRGRRVRPLKLSEDEASFFRRHIIADLLDSAPLYLFQKWVLQPKGYTKEYLVWEHAKAYSKAVQHAVGEFADLLTQAVMAKAKRRDVSEKQREAIWEQAILFGDELLTLDMWSVWIIRHAEQFASEPVFGDKETEALGNRLKLDRRECLGEADDRINLRILLAGGREAATRIDRVRREIAKLMLEFPGADNQRLCREIDKRNEKALSHSSDGKVPMPAPDFLKRRGIRLWAGAFGNDCKRETQRVHELFSKIRKQFGLPERHGRLNLSLSGNTSNDAQQDVARSTPDGGNPA